MERVNGLEYEVFGQGDPLLLIHGSFVADALSLLARHPALTERYRVIHYHRRGFAGSDQHAGPFSVADQARDALALLDHLGLDRVHVAGHSYGGLTGVQLAVDAPLRVNALVVMEPAIYAMKPSWGEAQRRMFEPLSAAFQRGESARVVDDLILGAAGPAWRDLEQFSGAGEQVAKDLRTFVEVELPASLDWTFTPSEAARIQAPVLFATGGGSDAIHGKVYELFASWVKDTELVEIPGALHSMNVTHTDVVAAALVAFFGRHPL